MLKKICVLFMFCVLFINGSVEASKIVYVPTLIDAVADANGLYGSLTKENVVKGNLYLDDTILARLRKAGHEITILSKEEYDETVKEYEKQSGKTYLIGNFPVRKILAEKFNSNYVVSPSVVPYFKTEIYRNSGRIYGSSNVHTVVAINVWDVAEDSDYQATGDFIGNMQTSPNLDTYYPDVLLKRLFDNTEKQMLFFEKEFNLSVFRNLGLLILPKEK